MYVSYQGFSGKQWKVLIYVPTVNTNVSETARADMYIENDIWLLCFRTITYKNILMRKRISRVNSMLCF